jgi:hypothetical protein
MSHIVCIKTQIRDPLALAPACRRLGLGQPTEGTARLYSGQATGWIVQLPGWRYPVVANIQTGELQCDNYGGRWGEQSELNRLLQAYAVEKSRLEARRAGHSVTEQSLPDGSIRLVIQTGGAA